VKAPQVIGVLRVAAAWLGLTATFTVITCWLVSPGWSHLDTGLLGCCDASLQAWGYWWTRFALLDLHQSPFSTNYMFFPQVLGATALTTMVSYDALLSVPLQLVFGLNAAVNLIVLSNLVLGGLAAFALIYHETRHAVAAFVASLMFGFSPVVFVRLGMGHFPTIAIWPTPLIVLAWLVALRTGRVWPALAAGALLGLQLSIGPYQGSFDVTLLTVLSLPLLVGRWRAPTSHWRLVQEVARSLALAILGCLVVFGPHVVALVPDLLMGISTKAPLEHSNSFAPDLLAYFAPYDMHPQLGPLFVDLDRRIGTLDHVRVVFPGYLAWVCGLGGVILVACSRCVRAQGLPWVLALGTFFVLSLGPSLHVNGQTQFLIGGVERTLPLPFAWYWHVPFIGDGRITANMTFTVSLCLAMLAGYVLVWLVGHLPRRAGRLLLVIVAGGVLFEAQPGPMGTAATNVSSFYAQIAGQAGDFSILEAPLGWRDGFETDGGIMGETLYAATVHQHPLINGYLGRVPPQVFGYFHNQTALRYLVSEDGAKEPSTQDRSTVLQTLRTLKVRYVILRGGERKANLQAYLERTLGLDQVFADAQIIAYRVDG
jgi:hypothetical protein